MRVLPEDEWIETGAQTWAASALIERQGTTVTVVTRIILDDNEPTAALRTRYPCFSVWRDQLRSRGWPVP